MSQQNPVEGEPLFRKVAVATDFGASSAQAVAQAIALARTFRSELTLLHVVEPSPLGPDRAILEGAGQRALDAAVVRARDDIPTVRGALLIGHPADEIISFVETNTVDLLVNGTHGGRALERWALGSVAEKLVRSCDTVLTVHETTRPMRRVLVATDFGASSERAAEMAARIAKAHGARLTLLHTVDDSVPVYSVDALYASSLAPSLDDLTLVARTRLEELAARLKALVPAPEVLVRRGRPWTAVTAEADEGDYDLVVMGTHGHKGLTRWLLGSVAEKVVRSSSPPVLTVRAKK